LLKATIDDIDSIFYSMNCH